MLNRFSQWSHTYWASMKIFDFQRHSTNIRNSLIQQGKLLLYSPEFHWKFFLNILGISYGNVPRTYIFTRESWFKNLAIGLTRSIWKCNFHFRTNSVKTNDQIFQQFQNTLVVFNPFSVHFLNLGDKKRYSRKSSSVMHN